MDFFSAQDKARKRTGRLVFMYIGAIGGMIVCLYAATVFLLFYTAQEDDLPVPLWQPELFVGVAFCSIAIIMGASLVKWMRLKGGGRIVAQSLGGQRVSPDTRDPDEKRLYNVVEEMALAAGLRIPEVYILPDDSINAFAAGYSQNDAVIGVTRGSLQHFSRDELQGVIAHEFSHILNGDMRLNIRLISLISGIVIFITIGRIVLNFTSVGKSRSKKGGAGPLVFALALMLIGALGYFFGRLIQAAVSRQREYLADASAVQFTRNPAGLAGALRKIATTGSQISSPRAVESAHLFFSASERSSIFATHPPLAERINAIEPHTDGKVPSRPAVAQKSTSETKAPFAPIPHGMSAVAALAAMGSLEQSDPNLGHAIIQTIPQPLYDMAHSASTAKALILALLANDDTKARATQDQAAQQYLSVAEQEAYQQANSLLTGFSHEKRLKLADLALPSLRGMSQEDIVHWQSMLTTFVHADAHVSFYEIALLHIAWRYQQPLTRHKPISSPDHVAGDIELILSEVAYIGANTQEEAEKAFATVANMDCLSTPLRLLPKEDQQPDRLAEAIRHLDETSMGFKQQLLFAAAKIMAADSYLQAAELEFMSALSAALNCPAPPFSQVTGS